MGFIITWQLIGPNERAFLRSRGLVLWLSIQSIVGSGQTTPIYHVLQPTLLDTFHFFHFGCTTSKHNRRRADASATRRMVRNLTKIDAPRETYDFVKRRKGISPIAILEDTVLQDWLGYTAQLFQSLSREDTVTKSCLPKLYFSWFVV